MSSDELLGRLAQAKHMQDQNIAFYTEKLAGIVDAYRTNTKKYDREQLLANMSKAFIDVGNTPQDLAHMLVIAVDQLARK